MVVGGGAAGFFAALRAKENNLSADVILIEKANVLLSKVRISGGGRCNVTHSCFEPKELIKNYPRGSRELLGPFNAFQPRDTIEWFQQRGVELKTEADGRMFPVTNSSETIIDCLMNQARKLGVEIRTKTSIEKVEKKEDCFQVTLGDGSMLKINSLLVATGSHPSGHRIAQQFGHTVQPLVPSLFTFNLPTSPLKDLAGIVVEQVVVGLEGGALQQRGPLLITHWGFSGPAALKLSAWGARYLNERNYQTALLVDWAPNVSYDVLSEQMKQLRIKFPAQTLVNNVPCKLPKNLWKRFVELCGLGDKRLSTIGNDELKQICQKLKKDNYQIDGKTTNKEEFVTCGGVNLKEVNFKTMESKLCPGLYFAGEVLDVDAVTGGFNFQNAWTTGWLAGSAMS